MSVNSLPKTVTRQRRGCDLNPGRTAPESSTLTTRLPSQPSLHRQYEPVDGAVTRGAAVIRESFTTDLVLSGTSNFYVRSFYDTIRYEMLF